MDYLDEQLFRPADRQSGNQVKNTHPYGVARDPKGTGACRASASSTLAHTISAVISAIEVSGLQISDYRKRRPADMAACFKEIFAWHAAGKLEPLPTKVYPLEQFATAMHDIADRKARGRVVLAVRSGP